MRANRIAKIVSLLIDLHSNYPRIGVAKSPPFHTDQTAAATFGSVPKILNDDAFGAYRAGSAGPQCRIATGVLLYPSLGEDYNEEATIQGHRIRFATVDLAADAPTIRQQLLRIMEDQPRSGAS